MPRLPLSILVAAAPALFATAARAQTCLGLPSFGAGVIHLNFAAEFPDSANAWAACAGAGRPNSLFGNIGGGQVSYEGFAQKSTFGFLEVGWQLPAGRLQVCPVAGFSYATGPDDDEIGIEVTARGASGGVSFGLPVAIARITVVPNAALKYEWGSSRVVDPDFGTETFTASNGLVDLGIAVLFLERFSIQPILHIPFAGDEDEGTSFGLFASIAFGPRAR